MDLLLRFLSSMEIKCKYCLSQSKPQSEPRSKIFLHGSFYRKSDRKKVLRYFCGLCGKSFSQATRSKSYYQKKRHLNQKIARLLVAGVSQRECARILKINPKTVVRKFIFTGKIAEEKLVQMNKKFPKAVAIQIDDMETFEHTKCKPLSIMLAVEEKTRRILGYEVSQMPVKGMLVQIALKKYGKRADHRGIGRKNLFKNLKAIVHEGAVIKSDENPHYPVDVKRYFPQSDHRTFKGRRGAIVGQGELKKIGFDPIFDLNHTCATLRARMNRLFRRTWCTTKKPDRLSLHLALTAVHHNLNLIKATV